MRERFVRIASNLWFAGFSPPKRDSQKGVQFGNPKTIRENQAIRANLWIDSRESGHLRARSVRAGNVLRTSKKTLSTSSASIRDDPDTTTTSSEFILRGPIFHFWGTPGCRTKCPFYTVEQRENTMIMHLMCHQVPFCAKLRKSLFSTSISGEFRGTQGNSEETPNFGIFCPF